MARKDKGYTLGSPGVWHQYLGEARIDVLGAHSLGISLSEPVADLLDILEQGFIVAPDCLSKWDAGEESELIGSGPYRITHRTNTQITLTRVETHFLPAPHQKITFIAEANAGRRGDLLATQNVEAANHLEWDMTLAETAGPVTFLEYAAPVAIIFLLNAAHGVLSDARLRRALSLAIDRDRLVAEVMDGHASPLHGFVSSVHFGADPIKRVPHDPDLARQLIKDAGHENGLVLAVDCPTRLPDEAERLCAALKAQLMDVGIDLTIKTYEDREAYAHMVRRKEIADMCVFDSSPMSTFRVLFEKIDSRVAGAWWQGYANPQVEELLDRARRQVDVEMRAALYAEVYRDLQADPAWLTLYTANRRIGLAGHHPDFTMPADGVIDVTALPAPLQNM